MVLSRAFTCADYLDVSFLTVNVGELDDDHIALSARNVAFLIIGELEENAVVVLVNVLVVCVKTLWPENELCVDLRVSLDHTLIVAPCAVAVVAGLHDVTLHIVAVHIRADLHSVSGCVTRAEICGLVAVVGKGHLDDGRGGVERVTGLRTEAFKGVKHLVIVCLMMIAFI